MMNSHMPKGRGMIKWQAFASLPEQFQGIHNIIQEQTKIEKPILDAQQLEEIEHNIQQGVPPAFRKKTALRKISNKKLILSYS